tara:strand:- start:507 stop:2402 length:1896 start_codon:yes stop_codon:yes gene_type:complete
MNINNIKNKLSTLLLSEDITCIKETFENLNNNNNDDELEKNIINKELIIKTNSKINKDLYSDLEIFIDYKNGSNTIFNKLNKTYTSGGKYYLKQLLLNPNSDIKYLNNKIISLDNLLNLIKNNEEDILSNLNLLQNNEQNVFWILNENSIENNNLINILYFNNFFSKYLNNYSYVLTSTNLYKIFISPMVGLLSPLITLLLPYIVVRFKFKIKLSFITYIKFVYNYYVNLNFGKLFGNSYIEIFRKISMLATILFFFNGIFNSIELSKLCYNLNNTICEHINNTSIYIKNSFNLIKSIYNPELFRSIFNIDIINPNLLDENNNDSFISNFLNLNNDGNKYFQNFGEKLRLYKLVIKNKSDIIDILNISYLCDVICSLYLLKKEYSLIYPNFKYTIKDTNEPYINIIGLKHPNIDENKIVKNDIKLDNKNNIIITGPNAGGKSTFIKSIAINILLSQTICMNFCDKIELTPFYYIASQMNIVDAKGVESLFESEMNRIVDNIEIIKNCNENKKLSIIFLDELFNSTNIIEGISGSYGICSNLSKIKTNITLLTTHFTYLYKLKKTGCFQNYKMNAIIENDNIIFPYKISKGLSKQYIALELLKNKLLNNDNKSIINKDIIKESIKFKNELFK